MPQSYDLPGLGEPTNRHLSNPSLAGIRSGLTDPLKLVDPTMDVWDDEYEVDDDVDLASTNAAFRKALTFDARNEEFMTSLNQELAGEPSYPVTTAVLGEIAGLIPGAGTAFTVVTTGLSTFQQSLSVLARLGDEVWVSEQVGTVGSEAVHQEQIWLLDPYRLQGTDEELQAVWVLHEERTPVTLP